MDRKNGEWELNFSLSRKQLYWYNTKTKKLYEHDEIPDGVSISDVGDRCLVRNPIEKTYHWYNFRTNTLEEKYSGPIVTSPVKTMGWRDYPDGVRFNANPYGRRRQHPAFDERPTRLWRQWNQIRIKDNGDCKEVIDDEPAAKKQKIEEEESTNAMAEETKENRRIANRDKVRKCRERMDEVSTAVAKLENTLRKRLFRQKEKHTKIWFRCDDHLLPTTDKKLDHQKTEEQKTSDRDRVRTC